MKTILSLIRGCVLGQAALNLITLFIATPFIWYVFVFSKSVLDWSTSIVIVFLVIGLAAMFKKNSHCQFNNTNMKETNGKDRIFIC